MLTPDVPIYRRAKAEYLKLQWPRPFEIRSACADPSLKSPHSRFSLGFKNQSLSAFPSLFTDPGWMQLLGSAGPVGSSVLREIGATVISKHCGGPNSGLGFDELMIFYCARFGDSVEVERPQVN